MRGLLTLSHARRPVQRHVAGLPAPRREPHLPRPRLPPAKRARRLHLGRLCRPHDAPHVVHECASTAQAPRGARDPVLGEPRGPDLQVLDRHHAVAQAHQHWRLAAVGRLRGRSQDRRRQVAHPPRPRLRRGRHPRLLRAPRPADSGPSVCGPVWVGQDRPPSRADRERAADLVVQGAPSLLPLARAAEERALTPLPTARRTSTSTRSRASPSTASTRSRRTSASGSSSSPRSSRFSARPTSAASPSSTSPRCATRAGTASTGARPSR